MRSSLSAGFSCLALAASAASPDFRTPPLGAAGLATNNVVTWGGYTIGGRRDGCADHIWIDRDAPTHELTVCSWVAIHDADGAHFTPGGGGYSPRGTAALPNFCYSPNVERSAPDLLGGAWGWGTNAVAVAGSLSFDYPFRAATSPLPDGYRLLEYVESTGEQRIRLSPWNFSDSAYARCRFSFAKVPDTRNGVVFGCGQGIYQRNKAFALFTSGVYYIQANRTLTALCGSSPAFPVGPSVDAKWHDVELGLTSGFVVDGVQYSDFSSNTVSPSSIPSAARRFQLFAYFNSNDGSIAPNYGITYGKCRIASFYGTDGNGHVYDLVAAKDASGVAGLWDRVAGRMLYSDTSTPLVAGPELPFYEMLGWNGGATGTNCFPRGVYTVAWTNLSSTMTLTAGGADMTLEAPAGVSNVVPGPADGFMLTGSGTGCVGISRMKVHPFYSTGRGNPDGADAAALSAFNRLLVGTNWCFVAHRVRLDADTHTNALVIAQQDGRTYRKGGACELPPDGTRSLLPSGWYQLLYLAGGSMRGTYVYEWDRRVFDRWLDDDDLAAIFEDGVRTRAAFGYPSAVVTNAIYQVDP